MNITEAISRHANQNPGAMAVATPKLRLTFQQLDELVWSVASRLHAAGLRPGMRVGLSLGSPVVHLVTSLALARMGAAHLALPLEDPALVRRAVADRLGIAAVIGPRTEAAAAGVRVIEPEPAWLEPGPSKPDDALAHPGGDAAWLILSSSGTTGEPKFAELTHAAAGHRARRFARLFSCGPTDRFWTPSKLAFVVAKQRTFYCLNAGAGIVFPDGASKPGEALALLRNEGVTYICATPSQMHLLLQHPPAAPVIPSLRVFEARSATISEPLRARFRREFSANLHIVYGTNEAETVAVAPPELQLQAPTTVGIPAAGLEVEVVGTGGTPLPAGQVGDIRIRGPGVVQEYLANPEATARAFRDGWFYPGDLGSFTAEGALLLHGRVDDMMILDGINIYPREIEKVLEDHPQVAEAAAFPLRSEAHQDIPVAAVVLKEPTSRQKILDFCQARLGVKSPRALLVAPEFPLNAMGKVLKRDLARQLRDKLAEAKPTDR